MIPILQGEKHIKRFRTLFNATLPKVLELRFAVGQPECCLFCKAVLFSIAATVLGLRCALRVKC